MQMKLSSFQVGLDDKVGAMNLDRIIPAGTGGYWPSAYCARYPTSIRCKNMPGLLGLKPQPKDYTGRMGPMGQPEETRMTDNGGKNEVST